MSLFIRGLGWWGFGCLQTAGSLRQHIQNRPDKLGFLRMASFLTCCCTRVTLSCSVPPISTYKSYRYIDTDRRVNKAPLKSTEEIEKKAAPHCTWHFVTSDDAVLSTEVKVEACPQCPGATVTPRGRSRWAALMSSMSDRHAGPPPTLPHTKRWCIQMFAYATDVGLIHGSSPGGTAGDLLLTFSGFRCS